MCNTNMCIGCVGPRQMARLIANRFVTGLQTLSPSVGESPTFVVFTLVRTVLCPKEKRISWEGEWVRGHRQHRFNLRHDHAISIRYNLHSIHDHYIVFVQWGGGGRNESRRLTTATRWFEQSNVTNTYPTRPYYTCLAQLGSASY